MILTTLEMEILYLFTKNVYLEQSILYLAKEIKKDYKNVFRTVKNLEKKDILRIKKIGTTNLCSLNFKTLDLPLYLSFAEEITSRERLGKKFPFLKNFTQELQKIAPVSCLGIFGSHVKRTATPKSDIDIFILTEEHKIKDLKHFTSQHFPELEHTIDLQVISFQEFWLSLKSNEFTVSKEIAKNKMIYWGGELFYQMIQEAHHELRRE